MPGPHWLPCGFILLESSESYSMWLMEPVLYAWVDLVSSPITAFWTLPAWTCFFLASKSPSPASGVLQESGSPGPKCNTGCLCNPSCRHCLGCPGRTTGVSSIHVGHSMLQTNFFRVVPCCVLDRTEHYPLRSNLFLVAKGVGLSWCVNLCENQEEAPLWQT